MNAAGLFLPNSDHYEVGVDVSISPMKKLRLRGVLFNIRQMPKRRIKMQTKVGLVPE